MNSVYNLSLFKGFEFLTFKEAEKLHNLNLRVIIMINLQDVYTYGTAHTALS